jgi:hypothetical protein
MILRRLAVPFLAGALAAGCASKAPPAAAPGAAPVDLDAARTALKDAQAARAEERAPDAYRRALEYLRQAEQGSGAAAREMAIRAEGWARVAVAEARCTRAVPAPSGGDLERAQAELKQAHEEHRRLEERVTLLNQALEQTETELIRSKARLKGIETKAEASSAIAEARILMRRLGARSTAATLCQDSLAKAEQQLAVENYGAAMFFALKAQDLANRALATRP